MVEQKVRGSNKSIKHFRLASVACGAFEQASWRARDPHKDVLQLSGWKEVVFLSCKSGHFAFLVIFAFNKCLIKITSHCGKCAINLWEIMTWCVGYTTTRIRKWGELMICCELPADHKLLDRLFPELQCWEEAGTAALGIWPGAKPGRRQM